VECGWRSNDGEWARHDIHELPAKTVGQGFGNTHVRELADEIQIPWKIYDSIVFRSP
jgi:hypothetical protein